MNSSLSTKNWSLSSVPLAWTLCLAPHVYALVSYELYLNSQAKEVKDKYPLQRHQPRNTFLQSLDANPAVPQAYKDRLHRAHAASLNGYENLGFFGAAVVAANLALLIENGGRGALLWKTNMLSLGYCVSRAAYCLAYTIGVKGPHRGIYFYTSIGICIYMFQIGGRAMTDLAGK
jgi:uncharacterized MAPEG superfamily protein